MINKNVSTIPRFASHAQVIIPLMHGCLSKNFSQKMVICKTSSAQKSLFIPIENIDSDCITLENFLVVLDARLGSEFAYQEEIMHLKKNLCEEFNKLCDGVKDKNFIEFTKNQSQRIINGLIQGAKIEEKIVAEKFLYNLINGFEKELNLKKLIEVINIVLWKPLMTPLPIDAPNLLKELVRELENERSTLKIERMTNRFVEYIKVNMEAKDIKESEFKTTKKLKMELENLVKNRRICNVVINDVVKNESIVEKFRGQCIENVRLQLSSKIYLEESITMNYNELDLSGVIYENNWKKLFEKIPMQIKLLKVRLLNGNYNILKKYLSNLNILEYLNLNLENNSIGPGGAPALSIVLKILTNLSNLNLNLRNNNIGADGVIAVSGGLKFLTSLFNLNLTLTDNNIGENEAIILSDSLKVLVNLSNLVLDLQKSNIGYNGAAALSSSLKMLIHLSDLNLNLRQNDIGANGVALLSSSLKVLTNLSNLNLNLRNNNIGADGTVALSSSLKILTHLSDLNLTLRKNNIGAGRATSLSDGLKMLANLSNLNLDLRQLNTNQLLLFRNNNIGADGTMALSNGLKTLANVSHLHLDLADNNIGKKGEAALSKLRLANPNYTTSYWKQIN